MRFQLRYSSSARHALKKIPREISLRFVTRLEKLAEEEDPAHSLKTLHGFDDPLLYSLRIGQYRAVISVINDVMVIHVIEIGHRSSVYRKF
ncbi:type II toxin-antitoxin system RelE family toxin [Methanoplanus endosymbiosus]|uniref:Type II toxin-antitoxin system RelE/ParE family toxin n=1 Tax=Methanoplanus endosymbiosus TaxID=33865 RepID=A0A9E7PK16_9EURY|nr:type II toxin-antitoxin system RelE/ParE family toxin [Methanoplanus endosymbiosus]UUX91384.1 type II toxin-antitoxin system RelE/ParE family toxin [Methanoplanus endosymbiosus]